MGRVASTECNRQGPDYFGLFASEVAELISQDEDFLPISDQIFEKSGEVNGVVEEKNSSMNSYIAKEFRYTGGSASLFSDCFGAHVSNFGKERLKLLLRQSVVALSQEVDEDSKREDLNISPSRGDTTNDVKKLEGEQVKDSLAKKDQNDGATPEDGDVHNDLQFLLQNDSAKVESLIEKHYDELLGYMEEKLEELLDIVMSNCRLMTFPEKQHLRQLIRDLPPKNLDRVVQIFCRGKQVERHSCSEVYVDLENEDKATLWRLYFYIETVENAKRLCEV
ncbi:transcription factor GTE6 isoform X4 [Solanum lycopersicum]|uniref:transcription factor GTE6 isoform X4 n=1 Tax=Solanum lycopersicum TaxID=4081 RepID=UPI003749DD04